MSRIFDALQRSGTEQSGVQYPDMVSVATEVFEAPRRPSNAEDASEPVSPVALPDLPFEVIADSPFCAVLSAEKMRFHWNILSSAAGSPAIIRGGKILAGDFEGSNREEELLGWESPTYGELCPAISLLYRVQAPLPVRIVTVILAGEALQLRQELYIDELQEGITGNSLGIARPS